MEWLPECYTWHKNKILLEINAQSPKAHTADYEIDKRIVYDILNQICKDTNLYPLVKQHMSKSDGKEAFYAIHFRWFVPMLNIVY